MRIFVIVECVILWSILVPGMALNELAVGAAVGLLAWVLFGPMFRSVEVESIPEGTKRRYWLRAWFALIALGVFLVEVVLSAWRLGLLILSRRRKLSFVASYSLTIKSPIGITILSSLVTLTPGTLTVDYVPLNHTLYIHCLVREGEPDPMSAVRKMERIIGRAFEC